MNAKKIAQFGILTAVALVLGWLESFLPAAPGIPGVKLGLGNTVLLYAIYMMKPLDAVLLMLAKVFLSAFLFAGFQAVLYSLAGGALSLLVMLLLKGIFRLPVIAVSLAGAIAHNIGQLLAASLFVLPRALAAYAPFLLLAGALTGFLTGLIARTVLKGLHKSK